MASAQSTPHSNSLAPRNHLVAFFLAAYALMWACFFTVASGVVPEHSPLSTFLLLLGTFAPSLSAVWLTARFEGATGVRALLERIFRFEVRWQYYVFAVTYIAVIKLVAALIHRAIMGAWPRFGTEAWYVMIVAIIFSTPVQAGEEVGWRGYALPQLAARFGWRWASILLGVIWAFWHLPQFFLHQSDTYGQSFLIFMLQVTAISVAMAWLYARTNGSLLLTMLMHASVNNTKDIVPSTIPGAHNSFGLTASPIAWLTVTLLWVCAIYFLARMPETSIQQSALGIQPMQQSESAKDMVNRIT